jgi:hypothetical protein
MTPPNREWVTIPSRGKERKRWQVDVTFLASSWECIFGNGCQGVLTEPAAELEMGCCSYGAHASDKKDRDHVAEVATHLTPEEWQFHKKGATGVWKKVGKSEWRTRLVDDGCIFLNRVGFEAGPGCALHVHAVNQGVHFSKTKPTVCWQLPLHAEEQEQDDGSTTVVLSEFSRDGWGEGGQEFAWWCTEAPEAFRGARRVYQSMEAELRAMMGDEVYDELKIYLDARIASQPPPPIPHPAEVPVTIGRSRRR